MKPKSVYFVLPLNEKKVIKSKPVNIPLYEKTIYDALGYFEDKIFMKSRFKCVKIHVNNFVELGDIINLHDEDGLKINKIKRMMRSLRAGKHIVSRSGMPNIKLIITEKKELVLFDGHHTLISYMLLNKRYLNQVPHLIIRSERGSFNNKDISVFFGKHSKKLEDKDWREYSINWNVSGNKQISSRKRNDMGELFKAVRNVMKE